ncbi:MAG: protein kinase domain-containing protein [Gemmatimonas sp.]|uniref:protein kinase domain-containing protein n=1 Tax=Gemmatimonas sp. TaxID=1962908 RepID=UPI00391A8CC0
MSDVVPRLTAALADRYRVDRELGAGGMATVYLAHDLRHEREVAIKVLHPDLGAALGAERFLSEIKTTAKLQHPHILPLLDSGAADGLLYYVMPYVRGETLRTRLERESQLPVADALLIAREVADALSEAHGQGIVHRDIKPENILLQGGHALVADFGIALAVQQAGGQRMTQTGLSLGTPQYMAPEQAMGDKAVDHRADQYALAAVTYEMLTSEPPHTGTNPQAIGAKLLTETVRPATVLRPSVPAHVDAAIRRALEKLPADRFASTKGFADALERPGLVGDTGFAAAARSQPRWRRLLSSPLWGAAGVAALATAVGITQRTAAPTLPVVRFSLPLADNQAGTVLGVGEKLAIAPDGRTIAYIAATASNGLLYVRRLDELTPRALPGTEGARAPFFSPDGKWVAFVARGKLRKVSVEGGPVTELTDGSILPDNSGAVWTPAGDILFSRTNDTKLVGAILLRVPATGGPISAFGRRDTTNLGEVSNPILAPDGKTLVAIWVQSRIRSGSITPLCLLGPDGTLTRLEVGAERPLGFVDDRLIYLRNDGTIMAVPIDVDARKLTGPPIALLEAVSSPVMSASGTLMYSPGQPATTAVLVDETGTAKPLLEVSRQFGNPRYSPDGQRVAFDIGGPQGRDIWIFEIASATLTRLTSAGSNVRPEWSPDGQRVLYRQVTPRKGIWWQPANGSGAPELLVEVPGGPNEGLLSPDGRTLMYRTDEGTGDQHVITMPMDKSAPPTPLVTTAVNWAPRFSANGQWIAYSSDESGTAEIYVRPFPGAGGRIQVSNGGGSEPVWSRDGRTLYYRQGDALMAAAVSVTPTFAVQSRRQLFAGAYEASGPHANYDAAPDGRHLLMLKAKDDRAPVVMVINWAAEVRDRLKAP